MFCLNCGKELPEDAKFCSGCGKQIEAKKEETINKGSVCSSCGEKLIQGNKFCFKCGTAINTAQGITNIQSYRDQPSLTTQYVSKPRDNLLIVMIVLSVITFVLSVWVVIDPSFCRLFFSRSIEWLIVILAVVALVQGFIKSSISLKISAFIIILLLPVQIYYFHLKYGSYSDSEYFWNIRYRAIGVQCFVSAIIFFVLSNKQLIGKTSGKTKPTESQKKRSMLLLFAITVAPVLFAVPPITLIIISTNKDYQSSLSTYKLIEDRRISALNKSKNDEEKERIRIQYIAEEALKNTFMEEYTKKMEIITRILIPIGLLFVIISTLLIVNGRKKNNRKMIMFAGIIYVSTIVGILSAIMCFFAYTKMEET